jgi:hypothetical protein
LLPEFDAQLAKRLLRLLAAPRNLSTENRTTNDDGYDDATRGPWHPRAVNLSPIDNRASEARYPEPAGVISRSFDPVYEQQLTGDTTTAGFVKGIASQQH